MCNVHGLVIIKKTQEDDCMAFLIVTVFGTVFYSIRAPKKSILYALVGGGAGALSVTLLFAACHYILRFRMTFLPLQEELLLISWLK